MRIIGVTVLLYFSTFANGFETDDCGSVLGNYSKVTVSGCAKLKNRCVLRRGSNTTLEIDFVTHKDATKLEIVMHVILGGISLPFPLARSNACIDPDSGITCPLAKGKNHRYKISLPVYTSYPLVFVILKWQLQDQSGRNIVCTRFPVQIRP